MPGVGTYNEQLPCGGSLTVTATEFRINYHFPGQDSRYKGTWVNIPGERVDEYIQALKDNGRTYAELKGSIPDGGQFTKVGKLSMSIIIGGYNDGVCLSWHYLRMATIDDVRKVISSYRYAQRRSIEVQVLLRKLNS